MPKGPSSKQTRAPAWPWPELEPTLPRPEDARPADERLAALDDLPVIDYPEAARVRSALAGLVTRDLARSGSLPTLLVGTTDNGRTTLARGLVGDAEVWTGGGSARMMRMPAAVRAGGSAYPAFFGAVRQLLGPGSTARAPGHELETAALDALKSAMHGKRGLKLLVVDGCDALGEVSPGTRRLLVDCIRIISETGLTVLMVGTGRVASALLSDVDRVGPVERLYLPRWMVGADYLALLQALEAVLPLREPSGLDRRELALHLYALCDGRLGSLTRILRAAAAAAIQSGTERITIGLLDDLGLQPAPGFVWTYG